VREQACPPRMAWRRARDSKPPGDDAAGTALSGPVFGRSRGSVAGEGSPIRSGCRLLGRFFQALDPSATSGRALRQIALMLLKPLDSILSARPARSKRRTEAEHVRNPDARSTRHSALRRSGFCYLSSGSAVPWRSRRWPAAQSAAGAGDAALPGEHLRPQFPPRRPSEWVTLSHGYSRASIRRASWWTFAVAARSGAASLPGATDAWTGGVPGGRRGRSVWPPFAELPGQL
jgi:hypothetical protein